MNMHARAGFHGSYRPDDVTFLLERIEMPSTDVDTKERLIQAGERHYSEMITREGAPDPAYLAIYRQALDAGARRMGREVAALALAIAAEATGPVVLASLVRAGVPLGVLLRRALAELGVAVHHYGISIIRDRGLDARAMEHVVGRHGTDNLFFVDGWTGKGAITTELEKDFRRLYGIDPRLVVLADPAGRAWLAASGDDWLIPSGILGSTVSGLISRSVLNDHVVALGGYHGCVEWDHLRGLDMSREFVDIVWAHADAELRETRPAVWTGEDTARHRGLASAAVAWVRTVASVENDNRIKPGIAEATRAILRRKPEKVFVRSLTDPDLRALVHLARNAGVPLEVQPETIAPYRAITLIEKKAP